MDALADGGRLPGAFFAPASSSFVDFLAAYRPDLLPSKRLEATQGVTIEAPHGTTIVAGYDPGIDDPTKAGRIFSYDVTGGRYEEHSFHSVGSGSVFARGALKKLYREDFSEADAVTACIQALYDAADDDSATGGPDLTRRIFPVVASVTGDGFRRLDDSAVERITQQVVDERMTQPGGPLAPLRNADGGA